MVYLFFAFLVGIHSNMLFGHIPSDIFFTWPHDSIDFLKLRTIFPFDAIIFLSGIYQEIKFYRSYLEVIIGHNSPLYNTYFSFLCLDPVPYNSVQRLCCSFPILTLEFTFSVFPPLLVVLDIWMYYCVWWPCLNIGWLPNSIQLEVRFHIMIFYDIYMGDNFWRNIFFSL